MLLRIEVEVEVALLGVLVHVSTIRHP
jgi:hypothetical protein